MAAPNVRRNLGAQAREDELKRLEQQQQQQYYNSLDNDLEYQAWLRDNAALFKNMGDTERMIAQNYVGDTGTPQSFRPFYSEDETNARKDMVQQYLDSRQNSISNSTIAQNEKNTAARYAAEYGQQPAGGVIQNGQTPHAIAKNELNTAAKYAAEYGEQPSGGDTFRLAPENRKTQPQQLVPTTPTTPTTPATPTKPTTPVQPTGGNGSGNGNGSPTGGSNPTPITTTTPTTPAAQQQPPAGTQPLAQTLQPLQAGQPAYDAPPAAYDPASYAAYQQALNVLLDAQGNAPTYTNPYETQLQNAYDAIVNRPKFNYDLNEDMLYRQYAQNYQNLGRLAMQNTMGQAAALTGGYGSSYGQAVGQQQYNAYLQQLNNIVPELYQQAYQQYRDEGNDLLNQYSILDAMADKDYGRYQDDYNRWLQNRNFAADMENQAYNRGLSEWRDAQDIYNRDRAFDNQQLQADRDYQMGLAQLNYNMANSDREYQMALDKWNYQKEQDALAHAAAEQAAAGGSGGSSTRVGYDKHGYTEEMIKDLQRQAGLKETGVWGENEKQAYKAGIRATNDPNKTGNGGTGAAAGNNAGDPFGGKTNITWNDALTALKKGGADYAAYSDLMREDEFYKSREASVYPTYQDYLRLTVAFELNH